MSDERPVVLIDHAAYLADPRYRREARIRVLAAGEHALARPVHAADRSCCHRQSWMLTMFDLGHANRDDGGRFDIDDINELRG